MTVVLDIERPAMLGPEPGDVVSAADGQATLDDLLIGTWAGLLADHTVSCPVCAGAMLPRLGAGAAPVGGRCGDCGSTLA